MSLSGCKDSYKKYIPTIRVPSLVADQSAVRDPFIQGVSKLMVQTLKVVLPYKHKMP